MKKYVRIAANERVIKVNKYKSGTPLYCKFWIYIAIVLIGTVIDWITLYALYDAVLNGNMYIARITSFGIVAVLDLYSQWLPVVLDYMPKKKRTIIFGVALASIIGIIAVLSVAFRISTGDVTTSTTIVQLSSVSSSLINIILGSIPIASTIAMLFLSLQKVHWNKINAKYVNEQLLIPLRAREKELELSDGKIIDLDKIDKDEYFATIELIKAYAVRAKGQTRNQFALALGDSESANVLSESVLPSHIVESIKPSPIKMKETNSDAEE